MAGSEIALGEGLIGQAGAAGTTMKINDLSRMQRMGRAVAGAGSAEDSARLIALPQLAGAMSQIAVPMMGQGKSLGVLFLESERRLAFDDEAAAAIEAVARQAGASLALVERRSAESPVHAPVRQPVTEGAQIAVKVYRFDDSVFIDERYVIKGVAGRLLAYLLERMLADGRTSFTNREIRRAPELRLPEFKDNLETRLLLLARRLHDKAFPIQLSRHGGGVMELVVEGEPVLEYVG